MEEEKEEIVCTDCGEPFKDGNFCRIQKLGTEERALLLQAFSMDLKNLKCQECGKKTTHEKCDILPPINPKADYVNNAVILCGSLLCLSEYLTEWENANETKEKIEDAKKIIEEEEKMEEYKAIPEYIQQAHARAFADLRKMKARQDTHISRTPDGRVFMRRVFRKPIVGGC